MFKVKFHQIIIKGGGASEIFCTKEVLTQEFDVKFYEILHSGKISDIFYSYKSHGPLMHIQNLPYGIHSFGLNLVSIFRKLLLCGLKHQKYPDEEFLGFIYSTGVWDNGQPLLTFSSIHILSIIQSQRLLASMKGHCCGHTASDTTFPSSAP